MMSRQLFSEHAKGKAFRSATVIAAAVLLLASCSGAEPSREQTPEKEKSYCIIVDKQDHAIGVFEQDGNGEYTVLLETFPCALGRSDRMTPAGRFKTGDKGRWKTWDAYETNEYSPYYTYYTYVNDGYKGGLYFHGPLYTDKEGDTLIPESYEEIGTDTTSGCVRTTVEGAYWIYANCPEGTEVEIVAHSELVSWPGLAAIDSELPNWDPTDPGKPKS